MGWLNDFYQTLDPTALTIGSVQIKWYGIAYIAGFIATGFVMHWVAKRWRIKLTADDLFVVITGIACGVILGGRLFYVIFYGAGYYFDHPLEIFALNQGGMSFHGGLCGALLGGYLTCRYILGLSFLTMCDLACIGAPLGLFFGRIANFVNGELWGSPTNLPWAVSFASGGYIPRHPSQLYEALLEGLLIFIVLMLLARRYPPHPQGSFIGMFLVLYGIFRFLIEFVRVPDAQLGYLFGGLTMGQYLTIPLVLLGAFVLVWAHRSVRPQVGRVTPLS